MSSIAYFADDIAISLVAMTVTEIDEKTNLAILKVWAWLNETDMIHLLHIKRPQS